MNIYKKLGLIVVLSPMISVLLVSSLNLSKPARIRILTWQSPVLPLGVLMSVGCISGVIFSSASIAANSNLLQTFKRQVRIRPDRETQYVQDAESSYSESTNISSQNQNKNLNSIQYTPERDYRDPSPTLSVPFRIIKNGEDPKSNIDYDYGLEDDPSPLANHEEQENNPFYDNFSQDEIYDNEYQEKSIPKDSEEDWGNALKENWL